MKITANLPDSVPILTAALEGFVQAAMLQIQTGQVPPFPAPPVHYQAEDNTEDWQLPLETMQKGWGDCEDLAIWQAAGYRVTGMDPGAHVLLVQTSARGLHCVVMMSDGSVQDPSRQLMPRASTAPGVKGPTGLMQTTFNVGAFPMAVSAQRLVARSPKQADLPGGSVSTSQGANGTTIITDHRSREHMQAAAAAGDAVAQWMLNKNTNQVVVPKGMGPNDAVVTQVNQELADADAWLATAGPDYRQSLTPQQQKAIDWSGYGLAPTGAAKKPSTRDKTPNPNLVYIDDGTGNPYWAVTAKGMTPDQFAASQGGIDPSTGYPYGQDPYGGYGYGYGYGGYGVSPFYAPGMDPFSNTDYDSPYGWQSAAAGQGLVTYDDLYGDMYGGPGGTYTDAWGGGWNDFPAFAYEGGPDVDALVDDAGDVRVQENGVQQAQDYWENL